MIKPSERRSTNKLFDAEKILLESTERVTSLVEKTLANVQRLKISNESKMRWKIIEVEALKRRIRSFQKILKLSQTHHEKQ